MLRACPRHSAVPDCERGEKHAGTPEPPPPASAIILHLSPPHQPPCCFETALKPIVSSINEKLNFQDYFCIFPASLSFKIEDIAKIKNTEGEFVQLPFSCLLIFRCAFMLFYTAGGCVCLCVRYSKLKHVDAPGLRSAGDPGAVRGCCGCAQGLRARSGRWALL